MVDGEAGARAPSPDDALAAFLRAREAGLRAPLREAAAALVASGPTIGDKDAWVRRHLDVVSGGASAGGPGSGRARIRHEIYEGIVLPALLRRLEAGDPEAAYLLGLHVENALASRTFEDRVGHVGQAHLFRRAWNGKPNDDLYRRAWVEAAVRGLRQAFHEWPAGILIDPDASWRAELAAIETELARVGEADVEGRHEVEIARWREWTATYRARLARREEG